MNTQERLQEIKRKLFDESKLDIKDMNWMSETIQQQAEEIYDLKEQILCMNIEAFEANNIIAELQQTIDSMRKAGIKPVVNLDFKHLNNVINDNKLSDDELLDELIASILEMSNERRV